MLLSSFVQASALAGATLTSATLWPPPAPAGDSLPQVDEDEPVAAPAPEAGPEAPPPTNAEPEAEPGAVPQAPAPELVDPLAPSTRVPRDERGNPIVEYGESAEEGVELPYQREDPKSQELEYAAEGEGQPPEIGYDTSVQHRPPPAEATQRQGEQAVSDAVRVQSGESRQRFALELKFGPYVPSVDRNSGPGLGPYAEIFGVTDETSGLAVGDPKRGLYSAIGFEWQFIDLGGPLSIGTTVGFFRDRADGLLLEADADGSYRSRADTVRFGVVPVTALLGYRFELLADRYRVPLVPYARAGLAYGFWWSKAGDGDVSVNSQGEKGRGGSLGWQANLGMMLRLDFIDVESTRALDRATGINHTYLFGEYQFSRLDGFGSDKRMSVGDDTWTVGLAIAF